MLTHNRQKKLHDFWSRRDLFLAGLAMTLLVSAVATTNAAALYILTGVDDAAIVLDKSIVKQTPKVEHELVCITSKGREYDISLTAGQTVTIRRGDEVTSMVSRKETVSRLLDRAHVELAPLEMVGVDVSDSGVTLTIADQITFYDEIREVVPYQTERVPNPDLAKGVERVVQTGVNGERRAIYEVTWAGGQQVSRQFVEELSCTVVNEIIEYGTSVFEVGAADPITSIAKNEDGSGTLTFASGSTLNFSAVKSMTATAYTAGYGGADYCTATGTTVRKGVVAVDKKVIPLGTRMYIVTDDGKVTYGMAVAEDTGVRGNKVDLYYDTYQQCINFGRRAATVYILE